MRKVLFIIVHKNKLKSELKSMLLLFLFFSAVTSRSQSIDLLDVTSPSPTAYELGKFGFKHAKYIYRFYCGKRSSS